MSEWPFIRAAVWQRAGQADQVSALGGLCHSPHIPVCIQVWSVCVGGCGLTSGTGTCVFASKGGGQGSREGIRDNLKWFHAVCSSKQRRKSKCDPASNVQC